VTDVITVDHKTAGDGCESPEDRRVVLDDRRLP
jgi:hypothetical protein